MTDFSKLLNDTKGLAEALSSIRAKATEKQFNDLGQLYATKLGFLATRDAGNRVRGETVYSCSKIGAYLTERFNGVGPGDKMMWVGRIERDKKGNENWQMRPEMRAALSTLGWF